MKLTVSKIVVALVALGCTSVALAGQLRPVTGAMILARGGSQPLYLWNASSYVAQLVSEKELGDPGLHAMEASATRALADRARTLTARTVSVKVMYARTGDVSPAYGAATFTGMENVFTLTADRASLEENAAQWAAEIADGKVPDRLKIVVTGKLPPQ